MVFDKGKVDEEALTEWALESGVEDIREQENEWEVITSPDIFEQVRTARETKQWAPKWPR